MESRKIETETGKLRELKRVRQRENGWGREYIQEEGSCLLARLTCDTVIHVLCYDTVCVYETDMYCAISTCN